MNEIRSDIHMWNTWEKIHYTLSIKGEYKNTIWLSPLFGGPRKRSHWRVNPKSPISVELLQQEQVFSEKLWTNFPYAKWFNWLNKYHRQKFNHIPQGEKMLIRGKIQCLDIVSEVQWVAEIGKSAFSVAYPLILIMYLPV